MQANSKSLIDYTVKFGHMSLPPQSIFYRKDYIYAVIPLIQLLPGHILLIPKKQSLSFKDLEPCEIFDIGLTLRFLTKKFENFFDCTSSTVYVQNFTKNDDSINHVFIHLLPRKAGDLQNNDDIYGLLQGYDKEFIRSYNNTLAMNNAYSLKTIEKLDSEAKKFRDFIEENLK